jgi:CheY-like chemotaxis protein
MEILLNDQPGFCHALVMLVDDCSTDNFVNNRMLRHYSFAERIQTYTSSRKALEYLRTAGEGNAEVPSLILDLNMPMINGHEFIKAFTLLPERVRSNCRIVVLSSSMDPSDMLKAIRYKEVTAFISKPMIKSNLDELSTTLKELHAA